MNNNYKIRLETKADYRKVENLTREAFWNVYRPGCLEHYVLHQYRGRADFIPELDFVMELDGKIIGHVMYAKSEILCENGKKVPVLTFGPISIAPEYKRKGYGTVLLRYSLEKAKALGYGAVAMTGNIGFYGKSGFVVASTKGVRYADADPTDNEVPYFLIKELIPDYLKGIKGMYKDPDGYFVDEKEAEEFDLLFPKKEKLKLPSQLF